MLRGEHLFIKYSPGIHLFTFDCLLAKRVKWTVNTSEYLKVKCTPLNNMNLLCKFAKVKG